jgi:hypothetical protein
MNPLTLRFDDEVLEKELQAETVGVATSVLLLFSVLNLVANAWSTHRPFPITVLVLGAHVACGFSMHRARRHLAPHEAHRHSARMWTLSWVLLCGTWWTMLWLGLIERLKAEEGRMAAAYCTIWITTTIVQHMIHLPFEYRSVVLALALQVALSSSVWRAEVLASLLVGETAGYAIEHMMRVAFARRIERIEQLQVEKERANYDLALAQRSRRSRSPARREGRSASRLLRRRSEGASRSDPSPADHGHSRHSNSSGGDTNHEIAALRLPSSISLDHGLLGPSFVANGRTAPAECGTSPQPDMNEVEPQPPSEHGMGAATTGLLSQECEQALWATLESSDLPIR